MELRDALVGRRTIHAYGTDSLPAGAVERALEAAILAPNHRLTFPWRFTRVGPRTRPAIADLAVRLKARGDAPPSPELEAKVRAKILNPAELIVVSLVRCDEPAVAREDYASAACAIQNLCLSLFADGVGSKWSTGKVTTDPETYRRLGIDPESEEIVGFIWAGIPERRPSCPKRPEPAELVRRLP